MSLELFGHETTPVDTRGRRDLRLPEDGKGSTSSEQPYWVDTVQRADYVDGLRGFAVLAVLLFHAEMLSPGMHVNAPYLAGFLSYGGHGVDLFFVLSGFCLSRPTLARFQVSHAFVFDIRRYWVHRLIRILPPYYAAVAVLSGLAAFLAAHQIDVHPSILNRGALTPAIIGAQILFVCDLARCSPLTGPFWTMFLEFRWYFVLPVVLTLFAANRRLFYAFTLLLMTAVILRLSCFSLDLTYLPLFLLGIVSAHLSLNGGVRRWLLWFAAACSFAVMTIAAGDDQQSVTAGLAAFCLLNATSGSSALRAALSSRPMVLLGVISYSVYLVHGPALWLGGQAVKQLPWPLAYGASIGCAVAAGAAFWYVAERPFVYGSLRMYLLRLLQPRGTEPVSL